MNQMMNQKNMNQMMNMNKQMMRGMGSSKIYENKLMEDNIMQKSIPQYISQNVEKSKNSDGIKKIDLNKKDDIMKIINSQDFINGFWEINEITEIIKEKYKKEYDLLKGIKNNKIIMNDKVAITILIIYFINKEHPELLDELLMIIAKAKIYVSNEAKESYENITKEIGII